MKATSVHSSIGLLLMVLAISEMPLQAATPVSADQLARHQGAANAITDQLGPDNALVLVRSNTDELKMTHARFQQYYRGVRVFGGDVITHLSETGQFRRPTERAYRDISISVVPKLQRGDAIAIANRDIAPSTRPKVPPSAELIVYPLTVVTREAASEDATAYRERVVSYALAYLVSIAVEMPKQASQRMYVIDANSGVVIKQWSNLQTAAATGTGNAQYSGSVSLDTNSVSGGYELRDMTRGLSSGTLGVGNVVTDMANGITGNGTVYTDSNNTWGDGQNYDGFSGTTSANGQTAAVDVAHGTQVVWDVFKNVLGRDGIDDNDTAALSRVHYGAAFNNAAWDYLDCNCMTYGDGDQTTYNVFVPLDIVAHEVTHGVTEYSVSGGLNYAGESGGLNESSSDIWGTMAEFYAGGGGYSAHSNTIPSTGGNWTIGEQLSIAPLRYMYKPSLDGTSQDAWNNALYTLDPHFSSGPGNRQFYFLSQGASNSSSSNYYSSYLPGGMAGIGNNRAAKIHYRALTTYYTSNMTYADARDAHIDAASDLYPANGIEVRAVQNSFAAINVGPPAQNIFPEIVPIITSLLLN